MNILNSYTLVTGGCGFVGRHLVNRLLNENHKVVVVDNLYSGIHPNMWVDDKLKSNLIFHNVDARDFFASTKSFEQKFDNVFHLSAVVGGRIKIDKDPISVAQDLSIDSEFFNWSVKSKPSQILYASSSAAYPTNLQQSDSQTLLSEDMITFDGTLGSPDMTYGWSKLTGEYLSR